MVDIDSETLFNGAAAAVATIAVLFFILNVEFSYSPVSKYALVVGFLAGIFALTQRTTDAQLTLFGYGVIVASVVALFFETINTFEATSTITVLGLLVIAGILFSVRLVLDEDNRFVSGTQATYAFSAVGVVAVGVLLIDITTGGLAYELQPAAEVEYTGDREDGATVGRIVVSNPTPLPERVQAPAFEVCAAGNWSQYRRQTDETDPERVVEIHAHVEDGYNEFVFGFGQKAYPIRFHLDGPLLRGTTFPVQVTDRCPNDATGRPYVALYQRPDGRFGTPD